MGFHQDNTPTNISEKKRNAFFDASRINYVKSEEWMSKSPDVVPMGYSIWEYLKRQLNKQNIEMLDELKKFYTNGKSWIKLILTKF